MKSSSKYKAKELISKFFTIIDDNKTTSYNWGFSTAKECVLIFIDEMINQFKEMNNNIMGLQFDGKLEYWQQVKEEIKIKNQNSDAVEKEQDEEIVEWDYCDSCKKLVVGVLVGAGEEYLHTECSECGSITEKIDVSELTHRFKL